jgi:hypothetical protein
MRTAVEARDMAADDEAELWGYLTGAALAMVNTPLA